MIELRRLEQEASRLMRAAIGECDRALLAAETAGNAYRQDASEANLDVLLAAQVRLNDRLRWAAQASQILHGLHPQAPAGDILKSLAEGDALAAPSET